MDDFEDPEWIVARRSDGNHEQGIVYRSHKPTSDMIM
jgi:hypothetical protein